MTISISEAIEREEYRVEQNNEMADSFHTDENVYEREEEAYRNRAEYHRQLAEWLRELRAYREAYQNIKNDIHKYELDCRFADYSETDECVQCNKNVFGSIYKIIDKHTYGSDEKEGEDSDEVV